jgi:hypothetical protein
MKEFGRITNATLGRKQARFCIALPLKEPEVPNITMLDIEELKKTKLRPYIEKCLEHRAPDPGFHAMMGHNIDLCEAMFVAWDACFNKGRIPHTLKEIIRVQLSRAASCSY